MLSLGRSDLGITKVLGGHAKADPASGRSLEKPGFVYVKDSMRPHLDGARSFDSMDCLLHLGAER